MQGELRVIAGDIEESGLWGQAQAAAAGLLLRRRTRPGGEYLVDVGRRAARTNGERFFFDQGPGVNHVRYFENEASVRQLAAALTAKDPRDDGFVELAARPVALDSARVRSGHADAARPVVFLLPGIMGSHLAVGDNRVWVDPIELALGGMGKIAIDKAGVHAECPLESVYGDLIDYLAQTHEVRPFAYDWRRSMREEARRLAGEVAAALDRGRSAAPAGAPAGPFHGRSGGARHDSGAAGHLAAPVPPRGRAAGDARHAQRRFPLDGARDLGTRCHGTAPGGARPGARHEVSARSHRALSRGPGTAALRQAARLLRRGDLEHADGSGRAATGAASG
ncbi:MAG: hypothetical protein MZW92_52000 [Comamonadaceae bacterium]|nr:hypothetical protein [Comamonadaceae bacterium]